MVKSGLVDVPRVSPYRLTAHLALAVIIYAALIWVALDLLYPERTRTPTALRRAGWGVTGLIFLTILAGGFVAGTKAGFAFNTWPLMYGQLVPDGVMAMQPWWVNLFENIATVQFDHRMLAYAVIVSVAFYSWFGLRQRVSSGARIGFALLPVAALGQLLLGIATVLLAVPVALGAAHQAGALVLFTVALYLNYTLRPAK